VKLEGNCQGWAGVTAHVQALGGPAHSNDAMESMHPPVVGVNEGLDSFVDAGAILLCAARDCHHPVLKPKLSHDPRADREVQASAQAAVA
jgi:hypothetical protein